MNRHAHHPHQRSPAHHDHRDGQHGAHDHHDHDHHHGPQVALEGGLGTRERKLLFALVLTLVTLVIEAVGGWWSGSLALLADAGHMLVDALALMLAFFGAWMATRPADSRRTYGYGRLEVLAGFVNALTQLLLVGFIAYEAVLRLMHPSPILSGVMFWVALLGLVVNLLVLRSLHDHAHDDLNMASASLHVLGDLAGSVAAVLAALAVRWLGWNWADPALSLLVSLLILTSAWRLLRRSTHILLEGVPEGLDTVEMEHALHGAHAAIRNVHHLHVWQLASGSRMATLHVDIQQLADSAAVLDAVKRLLRERFKINHATVQIDPGHCPDPLHGGDEHGHR
ncbi:MAG: cation diffusion facilitator family transporter [Dyella sp.]